MFMDKIARRMNAVQPALNAGASVLGEEIANMDDHLCRLVTVG